MNIKRFLNDVIDSNGNYIHENQAQKILKTINDLEEVTTTYSEANTAIGKVAEKQNNKIDLLTELIRDRNHETMWKDFTHFFDMKTEHPFDSEILDDLDKLDEFCKSFWEMGMRLGYQKYKKEEGNNVKQSI